MTKKVAPGSIVRFGDEAMKIRDAVADDAVAVAALVDSVSRERRFLANTEGFPIEATRTFINSVRAAGGIHIVGIESDEIVGWCDIVRHTFEGMRHAGRLGMGVRRDRRSTGIGRKLLEAATEKAQGSGIERIELEVFASNYPAIRLYESVGFVLEGRKVAGRKLDGCADDILLYAKRLLV